MRILEMPAWSSGNSYNHLLCAALTRNGGEVHEWTRARALAAGRGHVVHVHWPGVALRTRSWVVGLAGALIILTATAVARARGAVIVYTLHNLVNHDARFRRTEAIFWRALARLTDGWIALSNRSASLGAATYAGLRSKPCLIAPIDPLTGFYADGIDRSSARARLEIPPAGRVLLFFGRIERYKGVPALIAAFRSWGSNDDRLLVVGKCEDERLLTEIEMCARRDERVVLRTEHVADEQVQYFLRSCDVVVAPYERVLNSSTAMVALSFERPILLPRASGFEELEATFGAQWIRLYEGALEPADLDLANEVADPASLDLDANGWERTGARTMAFFRMLAATR